MEHFVGIDGGGSKTQCILIDSHGRVLASRRAGGSSYKEHGAEAVGRLLRAEIDALLAAARVETLAGVCFGMPCYGESGIHELQEATAVISRILSPFPVVYKNDVEASWAGSFALAGPGITLLSGTGCMSITRSASGTTERCGGWSEFFSDEGSGYWLGVEMLRLFSRQADGRLPKDALHCVVREKFGLRNDYELVDIIHSRYIGKRDMVASLQLLLRDAALAGDAAAIALYSAAAKEMVGLVLGLAPLFPKGECIPVSYAGGLFQVGDLILGPFSREVEGSARLRLTKPLLPPIGGAALLAVEAFSPEQIPDVRAGLLAASRLDG